MKSTDQEWMRFEETHGKVHVIIQQFERIFHKEFANGQRDNIIFDFIKTCARTHLAELLQAGMKSETLGSYIQDPSLRGFWRQVQQQHLMADADHTTENLSLN